MLTDNIIDRKTYLGSSDCAAIVGVSPFKSPFQLYQEKIGEWEEEITVERQKIFNRGKKFEPLILEMLIDELTSDGHEVEVVSSNERLRDQEYPFIASESDMVLMVDGVEVSAEAKSVNGFASKLWGEPGTDDFPIYYQCQTMHDLMVKKREKCVVAALIGTDDLRVYWINRDEEIINAIRIKELEFWERVQNRQAPEPVSIEDIKLMYAKDSGSIIDASFEILNLCEAAKIIKQNIKIQETNLTEILTEIKLGMSDSSVLIHNGKQLATWRANKDSMKTDWQAAFHDLVGKTTGLGQADIDQIIKSATTTKPGARPFLLKG